MTGGLHVGTRNSWPNSNTKRKPGRKTEVLSDEDRKTRANMEFNLVRDVKGMKEDFHKSTSEKRKIKETMGTAELNRKPDYPGQ